MKEEDILTLEAPFRGAYRLRRLSFGSGSPKLALVAGMHGNELNGVHALHLLARMLRLQPPQGTVHLLPTVNVFGIDEGRKRGPFGDEDINQAFPGDPAGTAVQRIAHAIIEATDADVCIDVHSGSPAMEELPQVRVPLSGPEVELGRAMGLPLVWRRAGEHLDVTGLVGSWRANGRRALRVVAGRGAVVQPDVALSVANGFLRLMVSMGMSQLGGEGATLADVTLSEVSTHRSSIGGFFVPDVVVGQRVEPGYVLGHVVSAVGGEVLEAVRAERTGIVSTVRVYPMVHAQELLVRISGVAK